MLIILILLVMAVNGGLFTGAILFSAWKAAYFDSLIVLAGKIGNQLLPW